MPIKGVRLGAAAGAQELGATLYELPPGTAVSPYHLHYGNEDLLIVLSGRPMVRTPEAIGGSSRARSPRSSAGPTARTA